MKLFYTYTSPEHRFHGESSLLMELQIDNSLELGWKREDILLYTNFEYSYNGVYSISIPNIHTEFDPTSNKVPIILSLLEKGKLPDELYWYHDFDVYQLEKFKEPPVKYFGIAKYAYKGDWQCGSFFFRPSHYMTYFFRIWNAEIQFIPTWSEYAKNRTDEKALKSLVGRDVLKVKELNHTYNHVYKFSDRTYDTATKPILASHFHLEPDMIDTMVRGKNKHKIPFVNKRFTNFLKKRGLI